ncbi:Hypp8801 [Branchiostoma lanceolatum]|uniref:Hypp8801 protein n=1 Tax=Branchiostoma lanceolatum TaxID=7740 RepID=A0A8K0EIL7_BRALA|nr:Hypp8801 [Branchiostoma lanceolatum]
MSSPWEHGYIRDGIMVHFHHGNHSDPFKPIGNDSLDVACKGCFERFDTTACVRSGLMTLFVTVTGLLCAAKLCRLHQKNQRTVHQYIIFYTALVECVLCAIHWIYAKYTQIEFGLQYLKLIQFLVVCHVYCCLAARVTRKEQLSSRVVGPLFVLAFIYFTVIAVMGMLDARSSWVDCREPEWILLSSMEFVLVQLFLISGIYITKKLNKISTQAETRREQKRDLWGLIGVFELSATITLIYDINMLIWADEDNGCSGVFLHSQWFYSLIYALLELLKFMLPIWTMMCVFHPVEPASTDFDSSWAEDGTYTSVFSPQRGNRYRRLQNPTSSPAALHSSRSFPVLPPIHEEETSPLPSV